jgi:hypothetical protein
MLIAAFVIVVFWAFFMATLGYVLWWVYERLSH